MIKKLYVIDAIGGGNDFSRRIGYNREIHWLHYRERLRNN